MKALPAEQIQTTVQVLLTYLDDKNNSTPNDMLDHIVSGKNLLRLILNGQLVVCQPGEPAAVEVAANVPDEAPAEEAA